MSSRRATKAHSYHIDKFRAPRQEVDRLSHRARARIENLIPSLVSAGLKKDMHLLDVGSGSGIRSIELAKHLSAGSVCGIDTSPTLLNYATEAQIKRKIRNLEFRNLDVYSNKLPSKTFDFAYMRLVLQHLKQPLQAIHNIKRTLKSDGTLFIEDTDRDWMMIYPFPNEWPEIYEKVKHVQSELGGDPRSGRKIAAYLEQTGFQNISLHLEPVCGTDEILFDWLDNYAPTFFNNLSPKDAKKGLEVLAKVRNLHKKQAVFFYQTWFQASGNKA